MGATVTVEGGAAIVRASDYFLGGLKFPQIEEYFSQGDLLGVVV